MKNSSPSGIRTHDMSVKSVNSFLVNWKVETYTLVQILTKGGVKTFMGSSAFGKEVRNSSLFSISSWSNKRFSATKVRRGAPQRASKAILYQIKEFCRMRNDLTILISVILSTGLLFIFSARLSLFFLRKAKNRSKLFLNDLVTLSLYCVNKQNVY